MLEWHEEHVVGFDVEVEAARGAVDGVEGGTEHQAGSGGVGWGEAWELALLLGSGYEVGEAALAAGEALGVEPRGRPQVVEFVVAASPLLFLCDVPMFELLFFPAFETLLLLFAIKVSVVVGNNAQMMVQRRRIIATRQKIVAP